MKKSGKALQPIPVSDRVTSPVEYIFSYFESLNIIESYLMNLGMQSPSKGPDISG